MPSKFNAPKIALVALTFFALVVIDGLTMFVWDATEPPKASVQIQRGDSTKFFRADVDLAQETWSVKLHDIVSSEHGKCIIIRLISASGQEIYAVDKGSDGSWDRIRTESNFTLDKLKSALDNLDSAVKQTRQDANLAYLFAWNEQQMKMVTTHGPRWSEKNY